MRGWVLRRLLVRVGVLLDCEAGVEKERLIRMRKFVNEIAAVLGIREKKKILRVRCANTSYPEKGQLCGD